MRVCIYSRVSTGRQDADNQTAVLEDWAGQRGYEIAAQYTEIESAWKAGHQKELARLLEDARKRKFEAVLVWALDRLSREGALAILKLVDSLRLHGVRVLSYRESWTEAPGDLAELLYALTGWVARMESDNLSPATINQRLAGVRFYVHLAKRAGWVSWEVEVEGPKAEKVKDTRGPTREEFVEILKITHALQGETASRNRLMIYMFAFMALRVDSVLSIDTEHIDIRRKIVKVKWKGKKQRVARPIPDHTLEAMKVWLKERGKHDGPLFENFDNAEKGDGRLTRRSAHRIVAHIGKRAGIDGLHPHSFRHFSATEALALSDGNRHKTRKHTGHSSDKVLDLYDDERDDLARDMAQTIESEWLG